MSDSAPRPRAGADGLHDQVVQVAVTSGPHAGKTVTWRAPCAFVIGRGAQADLSLPHDLVASIEHCRLEVNANGCMVQDLNSGHGTLVNGSPASRTLLRSTDTIQVGMSRLTITLTTSPADETVLLRRSSWNSGDATVIGSGETAGTTPGVLDIPGYAIQRKVGEGGMGVVYEAISQKTHERVAIKTIIAPPGAVQRSILLFRREMELLSQLEHPRIVRFLESGEFAGQIYLVMEYIEAVDLQALVQRLPRQKQIQIYCGLICQVLEALDYAHRKKLVHRDVKPRNILIRQEGRRIQAKLADFGLAKNFEMAGLSQLTADNELRGTPAFMPFEQLRDSRYAKPTVDIYSSAATLVYYLTGQSPGHSGAGANPLYNVYDLPPGLADVLHKALAAQPKQRHATADELRQSLLPFVTMS